MTKKFSLWQLFSITDGRLATDIGDVYEMLNHMLDDSLMTHHLPPARAYLLSKGWPWLNDITAEIEAIKADCVPSDDWAQYAIQFTTDNRNQIINVPQLKDYCDTSDFWKYMMDNSLLLKIGTGPTP